MSFFNDLGRKISETSQGAVNKTKTMAETSRLNSAINDCKNRIEITYREIGNFYIEKYGKDPDPDIAEKVKLIESLEGNIKNMQEEIRKINGYILCPKCGKTLKSDSFYCDGCGEKLRNPETENRCAACGALLQPNAAFCTKCGRPINAAPQQPIYQPVQPSEQQAPPVYQPVQPSEQQAPPSYQHSHTEQISQKDSNHTTKVCPACGYEMDASNKFCLRCGEKL